MVSCEPYQTYKIPLKTNEQSIIEHSLVTIYLNLEWPDNNHDNPNLLLHIFDKKTSPKTYKNDSSMSYFQQNQSSLFVNSIHQQQNFGSTYQQQYFHHSSVINNESPTTTTTITTGDHNDVSSTTTTVVFSALQPPLAPPPPPPPSSSSSSSHIPIQQIKTEPKTQLSPLYRRQPSVNSSPICSSTNQQYLSAQHVIQTPSTNNMDTQSNLQMSPTIKTISPTSTNTVPTKQTMTPMIDLQQSSPSVSSYPASAASTFKAFVCNCLKSHNLHEQNCPTLTLFKQSNSTLTSQTIVCRPPINRTIAQRAAVASQNRINRSISMTPVKDQGQTSTTLIPYSLANLKTPESIPNITTIVSEQQTNVSTAKKPIVRQRSIASVTNARQRKKRVIKQVSVPNGANSDQSIFFNQINLNDPKSQSSTTISSPANPTIKLVSPFSLQTTVTNSEIDQTIDDVINGKGEIPLNDSIQTKTQIPQPSSQLVWVQNGTVTTKTWLSPLYQKQQSQTTTTTPTTQSTYDPLESTLTHQDVVNIAQQVVFPTNTEQNQLNSLLQTTNNSKKKTRSKSIHNTPLKRNRKPSLNNRSQSKLTSTPPLSQSDLLTKPSPVSLNQSPITPIHNLINKPISWSNNNDSIPPLGSVTTTNPSQLSSFDKNDSWQSQCIENVDSMLDEFHLVSIDEQRMNSTNHFDFDLSIDGFSSKTNDHFTSSTPPAPLTLDNQRYSLLSNEKQHHTNPSILMNNSRLTTGDVDVYDHFLNPYSSSMWQENQVSSSVSTPPDFQLNHIPSQHPQMHIQQSSQQYYSTPSSSQLTAEHFDQYHSQSQPRLLFDVQS